MYFAVCGITNGEEWTDIVRSEKYWQQSVQEKSIMPFLFYLMRAYWGFGAGKLSAGVTRRGGYFTVNQPGRRIAVGVVAARTRKEAEDYLRLMRHRVIVLYKHIGQEPATPEL